MNDFYVIPNNKDVVFNNLILPLKDYSIGFDVYYTVSEINSLSKKLNISVIINKFLHKEDIKNIINIYIDNAYYSINHREFKIALLRNLYHYFCFRLDSLILISQKIPIHWLNSSIQNYVSIWKYLRQNTIEHL